LQDHNTIGVKNVTRKGYKKSEIWGEDFLNEEAEAIGAGDRDRTCDLRFTKPFRHRK